MFLREKIKEIADQIDCQYQYREVFFDSLGGSNIPISYHTITLEYKSVIIRLSYEFGNASIGTIESNFVVRKNIPTIKVTTKSQMKRLFSRDKRPFIIQCDDSRFTSYLMESLESTNYNEIAKNGLFEPEITGEKEGSKYRLNTLFYLGFDDQETSIIPSINLHKLIIDYATNSMI